MVKAVVEKLEDNRVKIDIEVDASEFEKSVDSIYLKNRGAIAMPGFRKGKAPRKVIERYYGAGVFYEDAFEKIFPKAYYKAITENNLKPADEPYDIDVVQIGSGQELKFSVKLQVEPKPEIGEYKGIKIVQVPTEATEEDIDKALSKLKEQHARWLDKEDGAELKDRVNISVETTVDDKTVNELTAKNRTLLLGNDSFVPGFDSHIVGMKPAESKQFELVLPENYSLSNYSGKKAFFVVTINEIKYCELPELDDEFAKDASEFDTLTELKDSIKTKIDKEKSEYSTNFMQSQLLSAVSKASNVDVPEKMIENRVAAMIHESDQRTQALFGRTLQELDEIKYISIDDMKEKYKIEAIEDIKAELVMDEIAMIENLKATEEEIEARLPKEFPSGWKNNELDNNKDINYFENLKEMITRKKVIDFLMSNAVVEVSSENSIESSDVESDLSSSVEKED